MTDPNSNAQLAARLLNGRPGPDDYAEAQARATIAVAEQLADLTEQKRIGNVLAIAALAADDGPNPDPYIAGLARAEAGSDTVLRTLGLRTLGLR